MRQDQCDSFMPIAVSWLRGSCKERIDASKWVMVGEGQWDFFICKWEDTNAIGQNICQKS